uniref:Uncharacterized protein n=1 Tax=Rhizophagus irregularis (strain DAOM 181602 / DAOM 197198 / MUCL 43194) TaxID=747089 RepID=U9SUB8_RHIID
MTAKRGCLNLRFYGTTIVLYLRKVFMKEELQNENNIKFGITVAWMLLDPSYDQVEISSSKVQERMDKWDTDSIIQKWLNKKNNNNEINSEYNSELDENEISQAE